MHRTTHVGDEVVSPKGGGADQRPMTSARSASSDTKLTCESGQTLQQHSGSGNEVFWLQQKEKSKVLGIEKIRGTINPVDEASGWCLIVNTGRCRCTDLKPAKNYTPRPLGRIHRRPRESKGCTKCRIIRDGLLSLLMSRVRTATNNKKVLHQ